MRIALGADHAGVQLKADIKKFLDERGVPYTDFGTNTTDSVDYPDFAETVARAVADGSHDRGLLFCGSGIGMAMAANKVPGVRAALCADAATADGARRWNDANVLAISLRTMSAAVLGEVLDAWFAGAPSPDESDRANVAHVDAIAGA